jgi:hypothetical protein
MEMIIGLASILIFGYLFHKIRLKYWNQKLIDPNVICRNLNGSFSQKKYEQCWATKLPREAALKGIFSPFGYQGGHKWKSLDFRHFKCEECSAILYWLESGLYKIIDGPIKCSAKEGRK